MANHSNIRGVFGAKKYDKFVDFWTWFSHVTKLRFRLVGVLGLVVPLLAVLYYITGILKNMGILISFPAPSIDQALRASYLAQIGVIFLILVLYTSLVDVVHDPRFEYGTPGQHRLRNWWSVALLSFLLLYIVLWVGSQLTNDYVAVHSYALELRNGLGVLSDLANNLSTVAFLMCFSTMETPAKHGEEQTRWVTLWTACLIMVTFIEGIVRFYYGTAVDHWSTDWFGVFTGATAGVALAMFCGRLSSPLINPPLTVLAPLYLYSVVQVSFGFWPNNKDVAIIMANACLVLKCLLSLVIAWLLTTQHLIFYLETVQDSRSELDAWRKNLMETGKAIIKAAQ